MPSHEKLKNSFAAPPDPDAANSPTGSTVADKLTGGRGIPQEQPVATTVGAVITSPDPEMPVVDESKGFEQKPARSGKVR